MLNGTLDDSGRVVLRAVLRDQRLFPRSGPGRREKGKPER